MFICGSFHNQPGEDDMESWSSSSSPCSTPKRSRKNSPFCPKSRENSKNPYSGRGLDKFSALLADLDDKRQKIYTRMGSQDISFVRFAYSNSNHCKPIIVKSKEKNPKKADSNHVEEKLTTRDSENPDIAKPVVKPEEDKKTMKKVKNGSSKASLGWRKPSWYLAMVMILILVFLAMFGRSFAIICTSLGWYLVPSISGSDGGSIPRRAKRKKEFGRGLSENKIVVMRSDHHIHGICSPAGKSPRKDGQRRSW